MAYGFRRTMTGKATARLDEVERGLLRTLAEQLLEMVEPPRAAHADPLAVELGLEDLDTAVDLSDMEMLSERDPVLDRLFPPAYDDEQAAMEFRRFTELGLRQQKSAAIKRMLATLPTDHDKVVLVPEDARAWLTTLNDMRLALSVRLGIETEADHERLQLLPDDDPASGLYHVYDLLTYIQESLIRAMS